jgi:2'-5' RNA ligase
MPKTTRTFVALAVPETLDRRLNALQTQLGPEVPGARWTATFPFHATLAFLGDVPESDLARVCGTVTEAVAPFHPIQVRLEGVGAFPNGGSPRVLWAGLTSDTPTLVELQKAVVEALARIGYRPADDRFTPHVTLARIKGDRRSGPRPDLTRVLEPYRNWTGGTFRVGELVVFASVLTREGPIYTALARALLTGRKGE